VSDDVGAWRRLRRAELIARRAAVDDATRAAWSERAEARLLALLRGLAPGTLGFYWPIRGEFDARGAVTALLAEGWRAALPVIERPKAPMIFRAWTPEADMIPGLFGIPVPEADDEVRPDIVLAPLVGFDAAKYRLGYGGGYFDRTLAAMRPRPFAVGIGFEIARLDSVRPQPFDLPMDCIVTDEAVLR
jgi:5-formyltetrahydrofolate cyclo-ligase